MTANSSGNPDVVNPEIRLEDVRDGVGANTCEGRGRATASGRGYNAERLANAVFSERGQKYRWSVQPHVDAYICGEVPYYVEVSLVSIDIRVAPRSWADTASSVSGGLITTNYLLKTRFTIHEQRFTFCRVCCGKWNRKGSGKLIAPVETIDDVLDRWSLEDHVTMGEQRCRQISWHLLLKRLGVSVDRFKTEHLIDLTDE